MSCPCKKEACEIVKTKRGVLESSHLKFNFSNFLKRNLIYDNSFSCFDGFFLNAFVLWQAANLGVFSLLIFCLKDCLGPSVLFGKANFMYISMLQIVPPATCRS